MTSLTWGHNYKFIAKHVIRWGCFSVSFLDHSHLQVTGAVRWDWKVDLITGAISHFYQRGRSSEKCRLTIIKPSLIPKHNQHKCIISSFVARWEDRQSLLTAPKLCHRCWVSQDTTVRAYCLVFSAPLPSLPLFPCLVLSLIVKLYSV